MAAAKKPHKEWRCKNISAHMSGRDRLPVPCKDCKTVFVTETEVALDLKTISVHAGWITWDEEFRKYV